MPIASFAEYISQKIHEKKQRFFTSVESCRELIRQWKSLMIALTAKSFALQLADMRETFPVHAMVNLENACFV